MAKISFPFVTFLAGFLRLAEHPSSKNKRKKENSHFMPADSIAALSDSALIDVANQVIVAMTPDPAV